MPSFFLLLLFPILVSGNGRLTASEKAENLRNCGIAHGQFRKMLGGDNVQANEAPWVVRLQKNPGFCSGSLISKRHILVSGSCFNRTTNNALNDNYCDGDDKIFINPIKNISVGFSHGKVRNTNKFGVQRAIWLDKCKSDDDKYAHDVMILEMTLDTHFTTLIRSICVPQDKAYFNLGDSIKVFGFDSNSSLANSWTRRTNGVPRTWFFTVTEFKRFHQYTITSPMVTLTAEDAGTGHVVIRDGRKYLVGMTVTPVPHGALASIVGHYHDRICNVTNAC